MKTNTNIRSRKISKGKYRPRGRHFPLYRAPHRAGWTRLVPVKVANPRWMSSEDGGPVENAFVQPPRGLEPLGHRMTSLTLHHADGLPAFYHAQNADYAAFADQPFYSVCFSCAQASAASTPATSGGTVFLMGMPF